MDPLWKPFEITNIKDPYPMYKVLRETAPVYKAQSGDWIITRYEDIKSILKDTSFRNGNRVDWLKKGIIQYADKWTVFENILDSIQPFLVFQNPPRHTLLRKLISQAWDQREVDEIINDNLNSLWQNIDPEEFDLVKQIAQPLPSMTMGRILGLPAEDFAYLEKLSHEMIKAFDLYLSYRNLLIVEKIAKEFTLYFEKIAKQKENNPDSSLLSKLIQLNKKDKAITPQELISNCFFLFISGEETTASLISFSLLHLTTENKYPDIAEDSSLLTSSIEELLRFDTPAQLVARTATKDTVINDTKIMEGDSLTICLGSANRDPSQFINPDQLMLDRTPNKHLSFSFGAHYCLGDWLAKKELYHTLLAFLKKYKKLEVVGKPGWRENLSVRSLTMLNMKAYS